MKTILDVLSNHVFRRTTLTEVIEAEMSRATLEAEQARATIHAHEFLLHMARARITALEEWNRRSRGAPLNSHVHSGIRVDTTQTL